MEFVRSNLTFLWYTLQSAFDATQEGVGSGVGWAYERIGWEYQSHPRFEWWVAAAGWVTALWLVSWVRDNYLTFGKSYHRKHVFITGASQGLGRSLAAHYAKQGANVTLVARTTEKLEEAVRHAKSVAGGREGDVGYERADVSRYTEVAAAVEGAERQRGPIDLAISCAGTSGKLDMFLESSEEETRRVFDINYYGARNVARAVLPDMRARRSGHLVLVTSVMGLIGMPGYTGYASSKWAVIGMGHCLRLELVRTGVDLSICYPPTMDTPGLAEENKHKPELTWKLEAIGNDLNHPDAVARDFAFKIARNHFHIAFEMAGKAGRLVNIFSPGNGIIKDTLLAPIFNLIGGFMRLGIWFVCYTFKEKKPKAE